MATTTPGYLSSQIADCTIVDLRWVGTTPTHLIHAGLAENRGTFDKADFGGWLPKRWQQPCVSPG